MIAGKTSEPGDLTRFDGACCPLPAEQVRRDPTPATAGLPAGRSASWASGGFGQAVARRGLGFGMDVLFNNRPAVPQEVLRGEPPLHPAPQLAPADGRNRASEHGRPYSSGGVLEQFIPKLSA